MKLKVTTAIFRGSGPVEVVKGEVAISQTKYGTVLTTNFDEPVNMKQGDVLVSTITESTE